MWAHITLKVEISELIGLADLEELAEFRIWKDSASIFRILKGVGADIRINFTSDCGARHFSSLIFSQEVSEFKTNKGGLHKSAGSTVSALASPPASRLLCKFQFAISALLKASNLSGDSS